MSLVKKFSKTTPTCKVTFTLPKEAVKNGNEVLLLGEFNNWNPAEGIAMVNKKGAYQTVLELEAGRNYQFRYLIDGHTWQNDWNADNYVPNVFGTENSVVVLPPAIATTKAKKATAKKVTKAKTKKTTAQKTKSQSAKENLKKVEGIGPKIEQLLNEAGIFTFTDLSKAKIATLRKVLADAGNRFKMHDPKTWAKQAKLAAKGDWEKLQQWQDELKGGK